MVATEVGLLDHRYAPFGSSARYRLAMLMYPWQVLRGVELRADTFRLWAREHRTRWSFRLHHPHFEAATEIARPRPGTLRPRPGLRRDGRALRRSGRPVELRGARGSSPVARGRFRRRATRQPRPSRTRPRTKPMPVRPTPARKAPRARRPRRRALSEHPDDRRRRGRPRWPIGEGEEVHRARRARTSWPPSPRVPTTRARTV